MNAGHVIFDGYKMEERVRLVKPGWRQPWGFPYCYRGSGDSTRIPSRPRLAFAELEYELQLRTHKFARALNIKVTDQVHFHASPQRLCMATSATGLRFIGPNLSRG